MIGGTGTAMTGGPWLSVLSRRSRILLATALLAFGFSLPAHAQDRPGDLVAARDRLAEQADRLSARADATAAELAGLRAALAGVSADIVASHRALEALDREIANLTTERAALARSIETAEADMAALALARQRLSDLPPPSALTTPLAPIDALRSRLLLETTRDALARQGTALADNLTALAAVDESLREQRARVARETEALATEMEALDRLLGDRRTLLAATEAEREALDAAMATLARQIATAEALVDVLPTAENRARQAGLADLEWRLETENAAPVFPVSGAIAVGFGAYGIDGAPSEGIWYEVPAETPILAPLSGIVRFAGPFRSYGQLLIIEHAPAYHSLLGHLGRIDVTVGQSVVTGEPVGRAGLPDDGRKSTVGTYFEVRRDAAPVEPASGLAAAHAARQTPS